MHPDTMCLCTQVPVCLTSIGLCIHLSMHPCIPAHLHPWDQVHLHPCTCAPPAPPPARSCCGHSSSHHPAPPCPHTLTICAQGRVTLCWCSCLS